MARDTSERSDDPFPAFHHVIYRGPAVCFTSLLAALDTPISPSFVFPGKPSQRRAGKPRQIRAQLQVVDAEASLDLWQIPGWTISSLPGSLDELLLAASERNDAAVA
jgi:hypothetical protein